MSRSSGRGVPGPRKEPVELTLLKGNPGRRVAPKAPPAGKPSGIPAAPRGLSKAGRSAWRRYWQGGRAWLSMGDYDALHRACKMVDRAAALEAVIDAEGFTHQNEDTGRSAVHHSYNNLLGIYRAIADLERGAGLPATERSRVSAGKVEGDEIDRWKSGTGS